MIFSELVLKQVEIHEFLTHSLAQLCDLPLMIFSSSNSCPQVIDILACINIFPGLTPELAIANPFWSAVSPSFMAQLPFCFTR